MGSAAREEEGSRVTHHPHMPAPRGWPSRTRVVFRARAFWSRDILKEDVGLAARRRAGISEPAEGVAQPPREAGFLGCPQPWAGPTREPRPPLCRGLAHLGFLQPPRGYGGQDEGVVASVPAALPHRAGLGRGPRAAGRGGGRGADVAARQSAGEAERLEAAAGSAQRSRQLQRLGVRAVAAAVAALLPGS